MLRNRCAIFSHKIVSGNILVIEDQCIDGYPTLTNTIEEAVRKLKEEGLNTQEMKVVQKDSEGLFSLVTFNEGNPSWSYLGKTLEEALTKLSEN